MVEISLYKKHREQIKNTIIQTALDLFREKGYENISIDEITMKTEIAKGTFYNYFNSKADLLLYWSAQCFSEIDIEDAMDRSKSTEENLCCLLESYVDAISEERSLFISFVKEIAAMDLPQKESKENFDFTRLLKAVISSSYDCASIISDRFELKIQVLNSVIYSAVVGWVCSGKDITGLVGYLSELIKICLYGLFEKGERKNG